MNEGVLSLVTESGCVVTVITGGNVSTCSASDTQSPALPSESDDLTLMCVFHHPKHLEYTDSRMRRSHRR